MTMIRNNDNTIKRLCSSGGLLSYSKQLQHLQVFCKCVENLQRMHGEHGVFNKRLLFATILGNISKVPATNKRQKDRRFG